MREMFFVVMLPTFCILIKIYVWKNVTFTLPASVSYYYKINITPTKTVIITLIISSEVVFETFNLKLNASVATTICWQVAKLQFAKGINRWRHGGTSPSIYQ